jgi:hypothetical protein
MQTLVPIGTFEEKARQLLGKAGRIIQGTGGLRKVRFARPGKGKSGGARVIYYYHNDTKPILLLLIYAKADQDDLTDAQKAQIRKHVNAIIDEFS